MIWRLIRWRVSLTVRFLKAIWRNLWWVLGGAALGYLLIFPLYIPILVFLEGKGVQYSDETLAWTVFCAVVLFVNGGGYLGYRYGERRRA